MDLFIRNIEALLKAAKSGNENMIHLIVGGAAVGNQVGKISAQQLECIIQVSECLLEDM